MLVQALNHNPKGIPLMYNHIEDAAIAAKKDKGFTLVELLIVIVILGILSTVTVFAVRGITERGQDSACKADGSTYATAYEAYVAQYGGRSVASAAVAANSPVTGMPATAIVAAPAGVTWTAGATPADTLVAAELIRSKSANIYMLPNGTLYTLTAKCLNPSTGAALPAGSVYTL